MNTPVMTEAISFERLFNPASVAIVGASPNEASISGQPLKHLLANGYKGRVYPVNPKYPQVGGLRCFASVSDLPEAPDLVLLAVAAKRVPQVLEECGRKGASFVVILTSGFAESGEQGLEAQRELSVIAGAWGLRVIGPNCQGMMNIADGVRLGFGAPFGIDYRKGSVSLVSQSGAFGNAVLMLAEEAGLGFRRYVSTGNESSTTSLDLVESLLDDGGTRLVAVYVEGFRDASRLIGIGRKALEADKPLVMWKVGNSTSGARAAASHTANLCGAPELYRAAFAQAGVIEVHDIDELSDCAMALLSNARPTGPRVAVVTLSGGAGIAMADRCEELGLVLPPLADETIERLRPLLPEFATARNPLDLTAGLGSDMEAFEQVLRVVADDPNIDMIGLPLAATSGSVAAGFSQVLCRLRPQIRQPMFVAWNARRSDAAGAYETLEADGLPRYTTPGRCARGMAAAWQFSSAQQDHASRLPKPGTTKVVAAGSDWPDLDGWLNEYESKQLLAASGLPITRELLCHTPQQAIDGARLIGGKVVLKIQSRDLPHKSEVGGVEIGVEGDAQVRRAFDEMLTRVSRNAPLAAVDGVLVQQMVQGAVEVIVGVNNSDEFGPVLMVGLGGIFTEVLKDVVFRIAPIDMRDAQAMVRQIRAFPVLDGARGKPKADVDALCEFLVQLSRFALAQHDRLAELDINPLFVLPQGRGVLAGDALIRLKAVRPLSADPLKAAVATVDGALSTV